MSSPHFRVLIVGGGIAGPCLAFWLSRTGLAISITVVERSPTPRITGQAVDIRGPAVNIIKQMGLEKAIATRHTTETGTAFVDSNGKIFAQFDATGDVTKQSATSEYEILRADLAKIFLDATKDVVNVEYVYGETVASVDQVQEGVAVEFSGGREKETFHLIVGADGQASKTRSLTFAQSTPADCFKSFGHYAAYFSIPRRPEDASLWKIYTTSKGRSISTRPHPEPATMGAYLLITMPSRIEKDEEYEVALRQGPLEVKKLLRRHFEDAGWEASRILQGMEADENFYASPVGQVKLPKWSVGHCVLLGDAAFAAPGTGTSLAIEGAFVLAGELSKIASAGDLPVALERYESLLRPRVEQAQWLPPGVPQLVNPQTNWGVSALRTVLWGVCKVRAHKLFGGFGGTSEEVFKLPDYQWVS